MVFIWTMSEQVPKSLKWESSLRSYCTINNFLDSQYSDQIIEGI